MKELYIKYKLKVVQESENTYDYNITDKVDSTELFHRLLIDVLELDAEPEEVVILMTMDSDFSVSGMFEVSRGTIDEANLHPREIFKRALVMNAKAILLAHNHPGGIKTASTKDVDGTRNICEVGKLFNITVADHIIIFDKENYLSMKSMRLI